MKSFSACSSLERLRALGYEVYWWEDPPSEPERVDLRFQDVVPELASHPIGSERLYKHQVEALRALEQGYNVVLTARTGSGKTEAWALAALRERWRVLAVYPTLALSADQIRRLEEYFSLIGGVVVRVDRPTLDRRGFEKIARKVSEASVVVTNPAFVLAEMKRLATSSRALLEGFLSNLDLIVIDELDFYGPRGAHLLLAVVELVSKYLASKPPRVVVLSATLGNPDELGKYLTSITGRETRVVEGKPFRVANRTIVIVGKNLEALLEFIERNSGTIRLRAPWVLEVAADYDEFREHVYEVCEALEAIGLRPPRPGIDPVEVLAEILSLPEERVVTIVFARSIKAAEKLYRGLLERLPKHMHRLVAVHHHLISKTRREKVEEAARKGRVRMVITVRTLAQGIDIGTIARVVHVGLPLDVREYLQREGRKGRRRELQSTETIVVPSGLWDRKLLEAGASTIREWLELPLEKLYVNPENAYARLFKALWKLLRGLRLEAREERMLKRFKLVEERVNVLGEKELGLSERGRRFWNDLGFYEHGPPYGYRKVLRVGALEHRLQEEVSTRDAIEKYQPGSFDPMTDAIVVELDTAKRRIYEERVEDALSRYSWLAAAAARYEELKSAWKEPPRLSEDLKYGRVYSAVTISVRAPMSGFGELVEEPLDVEWVVESRRPKLSRSPRSASRVYHELAVIPLGSPVRGRYYDYTYGYVFEIPTVMSSEDVRLGLATLVVALRLDPRYSIPLGLLQYKVSSCGATKVVHVWEREAAGLLEAINWGKVAEEVRALKPTPLMVPLIAAVDPMAALRLFRGELGLDDALHLASRVAEALAGCTRAELSRIEIVHPRPSKEHGIASLAVALEAVDAGGERLQVMALSYFDGEDLVSDVAVEKVGLAEAMRLAQRLLEHLDKLLAEGFKLFYYGSEQRLALIRLLSASYVGLSVLKQAEAEGRIVDVASRLTEKVGNAPVLLQLEPRLSSYAEWASKARKRGDVDELCRALRASLSAVARVVYRIALALEKGSVSVRRSSS